MITAKEFYAIKQVVYCYRKDETKLTWTKEKVIDLLHGIRDNMIMAKENNLGKLYLANVQRINKDFLKVILNYILPENKDVVIELLNIQSLCDEKYLAIAAQKPESSYKQFIIKPLYRAIFSNVGAAKEIKTNSYEKNLEDIRKNLEIIRKQLASFPKKKKGILSRVITYWSENGFISTLIRIFKGRNSAVQYNTKRKLKS